MPVVSFKQRYIEAILRGDKTMTLRTKSSATPGDILTAMCRWGHPPFARLRVTSVDVVKLDELTLDEIRADGLEDRADLIRHWNDNYPRTPYDGNLVVRVIRFEVMGES